MNEDTTGPDARLDVLVQAIRACRICRDAPRGRPLPHEPRPVIHVSRSARICLSGQAPGTRVHASGVSFTDPSGDRLRAWMGVSWDEFYDTSRIAITPMGFCFPGLNADGADLPPRRECAEAWRPKLFEALPQFELIVPIGFHAQRWHLGRHALGDMTSTVRNWQVYAQTGDGPMILPLPHPSWRNSGWLKRNPWFEAEILPFLRAQIRRLLTSTSSEHRSGSAA